MLIFIKHSALNIGMDSSSNISLKIKTKTWERDSYGLFDYENSQTTLQSFTVRKSGQLIRLGSTVQYHPLDEEEKESPFSTIATIFEENGRFDVLH